MARCGKIKCFVSAFLNVQRVIGDAFDLTDRYMKKKSKKT